MTGEVMLYGEIAGIDDLSRKVRAGDLPDPRRVLMPAKYAKDVAQVDISGSR
jgi:ATP-dependent Lon protease